MKLNEKIAHYRRAGRLSQEELAAQVGVSRQAVSKWELGEASPDIGKLLALARAFGVTTDHLLNNGEDPAGLTPSVEPQRAPDPPAPSPDPAANLPGFLRRMVLRWGWLAGIYIALQGLGVALVGALARWGFGSMIADSHQMMNGFGPSYDGWAYSGPPELEHIVMEELGVVPQTSPFSGMESFIMGVTTIILGIGLFMVIGGLLLAVALWISGKNRN